MQDEPETLEYPSIHASADASMGYAASEARISAGPAAPTMVRCGNVSFSVIERDGRKALRVNHCKRQLREISYYPPDPSWRILAELGGLASAAAAVSHRWATSLDRRPRLPFRARPCSDRTAREELQARCPSRTGRATSGPRRTDFSRRRPSKTILRNARLSSATSST